ncbi:hypothetical protein J3F84DRAFT_390434 [Trichoderma pleuroticola]
MTSIAFTWLAARGGYEALIWHPCGSGPPGASSLNTVRGSFPPIRYQSASRGLFYLQQAER